MEMGAAADQPEVCKVSLQQTVSLRGTQWPIAVPGGRTNPKSIPRLKTLGEIWDRDHATSTGEDMLMQLKLSFLDNFVQAEPFKYYSKQPLHSK